MSQESVEVVQRVYEAFNRGDLWHVVTVRDGRFVRGQGFTSRAEALEAVGLSEGA